MKRLLDVIEVVKRLSDSGVIAQNRVGFIGKHMMSDTLPMSSFFDNRYDELIRDDRYAELIDTLILRFKNEHSLVILWATLRIYEDMDIDISTDSVMLDLIKRGESTRERLLSIIKGYQSQRAAGGF